MKRDKSELRSCFKAKKNFHEENSIKQTSFIKNNKARKLLLQDGEGCAREKDSILSIIFREKKPE